MVTNSDTTEQGSSAGGRIGFWLGLLLFVTLLLVPTPRSMREAAREHFAAGLPKDTRAILDGWGRPDAPHDSGEYARAESLAVARRAKVMMGAAAVTTLVACWWITVAVPIPVTSLLPLLLLPIVGVVPIAVAARPYADSNVFLFMGGFIIALGIERWGLHRRIALHVVALIGTSRRTIVLGFMVATAAVSMWISNTATTMMMLPIGLAVIAAVFDSPEEGDKTDRANFAAALMLGIAYAASIGGIGTPIGTPPNTVFRGQFHALFPKAAEVSFAQWVLIWFPLVVLFVPVTWLVLVRLTCRVERSGTGAGRDVVRRQLRELGPMRRPERLILAVFLATALLWMTRSLPIGEGADLGWAYLVERWLKPADGSPSLYVPAYLNDATVGIGMAVFLFIIPAGRDDAGRRRALMDWETAQRLPWGVLLLFGGGFAIATGFEESGLSFWCGKVLAGLGLESPVLIVVATCLLLTFLSEITSNTAMTQVMLPIVAKLSGALGMHPLMLMLPATIAGSCGFMLPVATPPNAIVFSSGKFFSGADRFAAGLRNTTKPLSKASRPMGTAVRPSFSSYSGRSRYSPDTGFHHSG